MKKVLLFIYAAFAVSFATWSQCNYNAISKTNWTILSVDSEEATGEGANNGHAIHAIDGVESTFWHTQWQNA